MFKRLLEIISKIIIDNIAFFILLGLLSLVDNSHSSIYQFKYVLQRYILPIIISYNSGKIFEKKYGGIVAVIVLNSIMINYNFLSFLEPIAIGLLSGYLMKKYFDYLEKLRLPGYEMILNNLGVVAVSFFISMGFYYLLPFYEFFQTHILLKISKTIFDNKFIPIFPLVIEPAKVFFMNNLINHSFLSVLGYSEIKEYGKSIFFLLETNPGPGLGILLASYYFDKKNNKSEKTNEIKSNIFIHFIGGIHEVYFPYVLRNMKLLIALVLGSISGILVFQKFHVGLTSIASPGSALIILLLAPISDKLFILVGIMTSSLVAFSIAYFILGRSKAYESTMSIIGDFTIKDIKNLVICVACDAGMGSSAMGATLLKRKLEKEKIEGIKVVNSSIDNIPEEARIIIVHKQLLERLKVDKNNKDIFVVNDFMDSVFYDSLVQKINDLVKDYKVEKTEIIEKTPNKPKLFVKENIYLGLKRTDKESALKKAGELLVEKGYVDEEYIPSIIERENLASTYLDYGISIPHCTIDGVKHIKNSGIVILQYPYGIDYGDGKKVYLIVAIASIRDKHVKILSRLSELIDDSKVAEQLATTVDIDEVYECFSSLEDGDVK